MQLGHQFGVFDYLCTFLNCVLSYALSPSSVRLPLHCPPRMWTSNRCGSILSSLHTYCLVFEDSHSWCWTATDLDQFLQPADSWLFLLLKSRVGYSWWLVLEALGGCVYFEKALCTLQIFLRHSNLETLSTLILKVSRKANRKWDTCMLRVDVKQRDAAFIEKCVLCITGNDTSWTTTKTIG